MNNITGGVAIIGGGLAGTALALALNGLSIPCHVYESRSVDADTLSSGVIITPNGCRVLDKLGILQRIKPWCHETEWNVLIGPDDKVVSNTRISPEEEYGYKYHRCFRMYLLREQKKMMAERGIPITYDAKFSEIISDTNDGVEFRVGGKIEKAAMLVGADGIHSTVRRHVTPLEPVYTGITCIYGHVETKKVELPSALCTESGTLQGKPGAIFMVPETRDKSIIMFGTQFQFPEQTRPGWAVMERDYDRLAGILRTNYKDWQPSAQRIIDAICDARGLLNWPFYKLPTMEHWMSNTGRVVLVGDAAHSLPASSGQGVNQALEDIYSLAHTLGSLPKMVYKDSGLFSILTAWQAWRLERLDTVMKIMEMTNIKRMPESERAEALRKLVETAPGAASDHSEYHRNLYLMDMGRLDRILGM